MGAVMKTYSQKWYIAQAAPEMYKLLKETLRTLEQTTDIETDIKKIHEKIINVINSID
jgi:hydroxylamine reductase (hybrid-cluster protein)